MIHVDTGNAVSLQGQPVDDTVPVNGQSLVHDGTSWGPATPASVVSLHVDVSDSLNTGAALGAEEILKTFEVPLGSLADGDKLVIRAALENINTPTALTFRLKVDGSTLVIATTVEGHFVVLELWRTSAVVLEGWYRRFTEGGVTAHNFAAEAVADMDANAFDVDLSVQLDGADGVGDVQAKWLVVEKVPA